MTKNITLRYWVSHTWPYSIDDKPDDIEAKINTITLDASEIREIFVKNGKRYYSLQSGHGQSTDLLIEECQEEVEMTDIICMCGHHINGHGDNGCIHCKCSESRKILELNDEIDVLRKQNEMDILSELMRVEFYGANGYCTVCHQPLEGRGCPYCGWEDKNPPQYGYEFVHRTKQSNLLCPICGKNVKSVTPDCKHTTREIFEFFIDQLRGCRKEFDQVRKELDALRKQLKDNSKLDTWESLGRGFVEHEPNIDPK